MLFAFRAAKYIRFVILRCVVLRSDVRASRGGRVTGTGLASWQQCWVMSGSVKLQSRIPSPYDDDEQMKGDRLRDSSLFRKV
jgi:hypothetical protein